MKNTKAEKQLKAEKAIDLILRYIKENNLQPGDRLPSERAFSEMFSVGRPVVREAARVLSMLNIIEIRQQGGMFVTDLNDGTPLDCFQLFMKSGQISLAEVMETRMILEVECCGLAAKNITDEQLAAIHKLLTTVSIDDPDGFAEADSALHRIIYSASGNRALQLLMQTVSMWTAVSRSFSNTFREVRALSHADHQNIYLALCGHDVEKSKASMRQHLLHINSINDIENTIMKAELSKLCSMDSGSGSAEV